MNLQEYISSGILEAFVLGALTGGERVQVSADIAKYPELAAEVAAIEAALTDMANATSVAPPPVMEDKIWQAIQAQSADLSSVDRKATTIPLNSSNTRAFMPVWARAAAVAVLLGSLVANFIFWNSNQQLSASLKAQQDDAGKMAAQNKELNDRVLAFQREHSMIMKSSTRLVMMHSMKPGHDMGGMVCWDTTNKQVAVMFNNMPAPPKGMQYQLWVIQGKTPVSLGTIPVNMKPSDMVPGSIPVAAGDAFAVSLEKEGGSPVPDMQQIFVLGAVQS